MRSSSPSAQDTSEHLQGLARRIRTLRERRGLTQEDFAARCGISVSFASLLERGERSPSYETLVQVSVALGVPLAELFRVEEDEVVGAHRLVELVRARRLTRAEVDRLLAVAEAMFGERVPGQEPVEEAAHSSLANTGFPQSGSLQRAAHYHRARRAKGGRPSP